MDHLKWGCTAAVWEGDRSETANSKGNETVNSSKDKSDEGPGLG